MTPCLRTLPLTSRAGALFPCWHSCLPAVCVNHAKCCPFCVRQLNFSEPAHKEKACVDTGRRHCLPAGKTALPRDRAHGNLTMGLRHLQNISVAEPPSLSCPVTVIPIVPYQFGPPVVSLETGSRSCHLSLLAPNGPFCAGGFFSRDQSTGLRLACLLVPEFANRLWDCR